MTTEAGAELVVEVVEVVVEIQGCTVTASQHSLHSSPARGLIIPNTRSRTVATTTTTSRTTRTPHTARRTPHATAATAH
ncbi:hypothetical protein E2C01_066640 [Portunus trituberculatus]|uniref:Uncharacterized protein n=1 Tax=Portunus trituberculatus TaxID=210409 RepID=A0A5B7HSV8_PORTR|nr:hypothetical protein [Portunus trituberculatus]